MEWQRTVYARDERKQRRWRYDDLIILLNDKDRLIKWLMGKVCWPNLDYVLFVEAT